MNNKQEWTAAQNNAINCRGGTVLVSAAAGSGKTAVLVERVIKIITDRENPVDANSILVVTFSNAAAAEMKQRILSHLSALISKNPSDTYLLRQRTLLSASHISTVHAFCLDLVRSHFQFLDLPQDFRLGNEKEISLTKDDIAREILEKYYEEGDSRFSDLVELVSSGRDDDALVKTLQTLYNFIRSHPFYNSWLDVKLLMYDDSIPVEDTVWGQVILNYAYDAIKYAVQITQKSLDEIRDDDAISKAYLSAFEGDIVQLKILEEQLRIGKWDDICRALTNVRFQRLGTLRNYEDSVKKELIQSNRKSVQEIIKNLSGRQFCANSTEFREDIRFLKPMIETLFELVKAYDVRLLEEKRSKHLVDFSDLEHFAVELLMEKSGGQLRKTELAESLSNKFSFVLVDEYQDTNETQDMIFKSVSRAENLFMVGDVKQSIYRFRQAMPEIFMGKRNTFSDFDGKNYPAKIMLSNNFRSRSEVTDCINYVFRAIMSREVGELNYDDSESLVSSATYPEKHDSQTEVHFIENKNEEFSDAKAEAIYTANRIIELLDSKFTVTVEGKTRALKPKDICILLRSPKSKVDTYTKALSERGLSVWADSRSGFLASTEIMTALSLIRVVNNPLIDIHLTAAMMSSVFGFTADEMAIIRLHNRKNHIYLNCLELAESADLSSQSKSIATHCKAFVHEITDLRVLSSTCSAHLFIQKMVDKTGLWDLTAAMKYGETHKANLRLLIDYAMEYEKGGHKSIAGFLRFLDKIAERGDDLACATSVCDESETIKIMSIHGSKGLEFPVVFLCDTSKKFNTQDLRANMLLHSQLGFACNARDFATRKQYTTVPMEAIRLELERSMLSEEMRILYVAMTRAKEKLIVTSVQNNISKKLASFSSALTAYKTVSPYVVRTGNSYADWILMSLAHHPDAAKLCTNTGVIEKEIIFEPKCVFDMRTVSDVAEPQEALKDELAITSEAEEKLVEEINNRMNTPYYDVYAPLIPSKLSVSQIIKAAEELTAFDKEPAFLKKQSLTGAQKGTAMHAFLTYANHEKAKINLQDEIDRLVNNRFITQNEGDSLDKNAISNYYKSELFARISASKWVKREFAFMMDMGKNQLAHVVAEIGEHLVTVQGIADLLFEEDGGLVLVDFKTDRADTKTLIERYSPQLDLYASMIEDLTKKHVKEKIIYSLR